MIGLNKIGLNQVQLNLVQLNQLYLNTLCACQKSSGGDGFPRLPGDVTRWSFKGLTNEQMSKNPRLEDADHKGRFLTFKNFVWSGMSGCGGYTYNFREWLSLTKYASNVGGDIVTISSDKVKIINATVLNASHGVIKPSVQKEEIFDFYVNITGLSNIDTSNNPLMFGKFDNPNQFELKDGINHVQYTKSALSGWVGFGFKKAVEHCDVTIELLPSYPGFIIGDGVDDYAVTEKNFDFQDTYTVYTAFIPFKSSTDYPALCGKDYKKDFYINFRGDSLSNINFYSVDKYLFSGLLNGFNLFVCKRTANKIVIKNLITGASKESDIDSLIENPGLYYLWKSAVIAQYSKAAIAGQVICNGHFTTDEEDTKVLNWYKKEYPWLFFDQAWTVTGKTNEDTDRATIANITGNGNNLVLSNFGFAGNSGYGEYAYNWNEWGIDNGAATNASKQYNKFAAVMPVNQSISTCSLYSSEVSIGTKFQFKLKITGLTTNWIVRVMEGYTGDSNIIYEFDKDGTYQIDHTMTGSGNQLRLYIRMYCAVPNTEGTTVTVEQIPDHEGYLVTDGVDDGVSSLSVIENIKDFTWVGEFIFPQYTGSVNYVGIQKPNDFILYNYYNSANKAINAFIKGTTNNKLINKDTVKAVCSEGLVYDENWNSIVVPLSTNINTARVFSVGYNPLNNNYGKMLFKNIGRIPRKLSKEDSIKAYIYLQTLKAK